MSNSSIMDVLTNNSSRKDLLHAVLTSPDPKRPASLSSIFGQLNEYGIDSYAIFDVLVNTYVPLFGRINFKLSIVWRQLGLSDRHQLIRGYMSQWQAWNILIEVCGLGTIHQRHLTLSKLINARAFDICLTTLNHRLLLFRGRAVHLLRASCSESFLPQRLPSQDVAIFISALCTLALQDPDTLYGQLTGPESEMQWNLAKLSFEDPWNKNDESRHLMTRRFFGELQMFALDAARILLAMGLNSSPRARLNVIKHSPEIYDLLLDCGILAHLHGYPEGVSGPLACEALCAFFNWPADTLPGIPHLEALTTLGTKDTKAMIQLGQAWINSVSDSEETERWMRSYTATKALYSSSRSPFTKELYENLSQAASRSRISVLRVVATLTYNADAAGIKNVDIYSLLELAYQGSFKIVAGPDGYPDPFHVSPEYVLGPIAFARLLVVLAQRNALNGVQFLQKSPQGLSSTTSLSRIQHITHPDIIRRFIRISVGRIRDRLAEAYTLRDKGFNGASGVPHSCVAFADAAELAAAVVAFDNITGGDYTQAAFRARYMLVVCLGHVAQMALELKHYQRVYFCALAALDVNEKSARDEKVDKSLVKVYNQRAQEAKIALGL
ncbi:hypothetical protein CONPUDRAFT_75787 [Coniophora puteana RWD-64-598 SS2]|uniref:Uncharacterized protein n=1 Tax=Coniophora puteana (strain RWD-64-598) TaxID=741705 RepID=A0A5M3MFQ8_CONPW|nr:uncharacterized protein CONPUDRAFT_75787 [Coniophora puteana RWD-64-598 SS2]EIW78052.1 hypothetical protein CONPUDRAFT_75787 [Coniophora puteana RWD-64-598 SS2]